MSAIRAPAIRAEAARYREPVKPAVAEDMKAVLGGFAASEPDQASPPSGRTTQVRTILASGRSGPAGGRAGFAAGAIAGVAGILFGVVVARGTSNSLPAPARPGLSAIAQSASSAVQGKAEITPPPAATAAAEPAPVPRAPAVVPSPEARPPTEKPVQVARSIRSSARAARIVPAAAPPRVQPRRSCEGLEQAEQAWCLAPDILAADQQLRSAYAAAIDAGVEPSIIASYRKRWSKLRRRSSDEPAYLIGSYGALAEDLDRLAAETRAAGPGPW